MKTKWEQETLLKIKREFSKEEKYKILIDDYENMVKQVEKYKQELTRLKEKQHQLKKQLVVTELKYTKLLGI